MDESSDTNINMVLNAVHRMLNATASNIIISNPNNNSNSSFSNSTSVEDLESAALRETLRSYGSLFVILLVLFCVLKKAFPKIYNVRSWSKTSGCELAEIPYGPFNWIWRVFWVDDDDIQDQCGMDTLCFFRMLRFGRKVALMGCFNAIWLLPLYRVAIHEPPVARTFSYKPLATISIVHVPSGSTRFIGTVVAAYVLFLYAMWLVLYEFEWFIHYRHRFLEKRMARNYAVYVSGIPEDYRSSHKLAEYFRRRCCPNEADVLEAHCTLTIPQLEAKVTKRKVLQQKLEHAQALEELREATVTTCNIQRNGLEFVGLVQMLQEELNALDVAIAHASNHVRRANSYGEVGPMEVDEDHSDSFGTAVCALSENKTVSGEDVAVDQGMNDSDHPQHSDLEQPSLMEALEPNGGAHDMNSSLSSYPEDLLVDTPDELSRPILMPLESALKEDKPRNLKQQIQQAGKYGTDNVKKLGIQGVQRVKWAGEMGVENALNFAEVGTNIVEDAFGTAVTIVAGREEGTPREAGFVVFTKLYSVHSALQMVHHRIPNVMKVTEAPVPEEIFWRNVGLPARARRLGKYLSLVATTILCFFWSIPVAFISSLTQVSSLEHLIPFLKDWLEKWPGLATLLGQLAPLLLYLLNSLLLPILLREFSKWEGHVGKSSLQASVYVKMAAFMIIQTFFVSAISGSIAATISSAIDNPKTIIDLLANSLPEQSSYFLQIVLVGTLTSASFAMLRVSALIQAWLRTHLGPKLTENELNRTWMFLHPLADPPEYFHGQYTAPFITGYMVTFVYATITPITPCFLFVCFLLLESVYRLEFFRNYSRTSDSGGKIWKSFIDIILICMVIAQLTLAGFLALKKAVAAVPLTIPLVIITILFALFVNDTHMKVTTTLPTSDCLELDRRNEAQGLVDFGFVQGKYLQPALQPRYLQDLNGNSQTFAVPSAAEDGN